jgi:hypothetical protein
VLTLLCLYFGSNTVEKYWAGEMIQLTSWEEEENGVTFPAITFCRKFIFDQVKHRRILQIKTETGIKYIKE